MSARLDPDPRRARVRLGVGAALILVLLALGTAVLVAAVTPGGDSRIITPGDAGSGSADGSAADGGSGQADGADDGSVGEDDPGAAVAPLYVHVLGQVAKPGLYVLADGDRAVDAIAAAGGFAPAADRGGVNLARPIVDGEQLLVPEVGAGPAASVAAPNESAGGGSEPGGGPVDLNRADAAALETLPRVGPALAERIIAWREANGPFAAVQDLMAVSGIGEKTFEGLRDLVMV